MPRINPSTFPTCFWQKLDTDSLACECWLWHGAKSAAGYGQYGLNYVVHYAHRAAYELMRGSIPEGLHIDHLCRNRACCNPWHMEAVQQGINTLRGFGSAGVNSRKTQCENGHDYTQENTRITVQGWRVGRECNKAWRRDNYAKKSLLKSLAQAAPPAE